MDSEWRQALTEYIVLQRQLDDIRRSGVLKAREIHAPFDSVRERWDQSGPHSTEDSKAMGQLLKEYGHRRRAHGLKMADLADLIIARNEEFRIELLALCNESDSEPTDVVRKMRDQVQKQIELYTAFEDSIFEYDELVDRFNDLMEKQETAPDLVAKKKKSRWRPY
jgi:hypothetical protein